MEKLLNSNVTIITGGSRGIGRDIARNFSKNGSNIIIIYNKDIKSAKSIKKNSTIKIDRSLSGFLSQKKFKYVATNWNKMIREMKKNKSNLNIF